MIKTKDSLAALGVMGLSGYLLNSSAAYPTVGAQVSDNVAAELRGGACQGTSKAFCAGAGAGCLGGTIIVGGTTLATASSNTNCGSGCGSFFASTSACAAS